MVQSMSRQITSLIMKPVQAVSLTLYKQY